MNKPRQIISTVAAVLAATVFGLTAVASTQAEAQLPAPDSSAALGPASSETVAAQGFAAPPAPDENSLEVRAFRLLNTKASNRVLDAIMPIVTDFKRNRTVLLLIWAFLVMFGGNKGRWAALMLIPLIAATDQLSASVIKPLVGRARPCEVLGGIRLWYGPEGWITTPAEVARSYKSSFSFPSSHATNVTAAMLFLGLAFRRTLVPLLLVALLVSYSRIYVGVHWTSDVIAGMALGALLGAAAWLVFRRLYPGRAASDHENGADGLLDDSGRGASEEEISDSM